MLRKFQGSRALQLGLAFRTVLPRILRRTRAPSVLASGSQEREPGIWHRKCQVFSTPASFSPALLGGKCLTTSPPSAPMGRACRKSGVQKGYSLCAETFGAEIRRPARCGFCHSRSSQGPSDRGVSRPRSGRRPVPLQIKGSHPSGQGQTAHRACPLQPQRGNSQVSDLLRRSAHTQVGRQPPRLYADLGCGKCILSRPDPPQASQVLLEPLGATALCQEQVYRAATRRILCLFKTRPRASGVLGSNASVPATPLSPSRRVQPCGVAARLDQLAQDLDERHVSAATACARGCMSTTC